MSIDLESYKAYIRETVQDENHYWNNIEQICQSVLEAKEKDKYVPILDVVKEVLNDEKQKGQVKFLALRLLGTCINPASGQLDHYQINTEFVTKLLRAKDLLEILEDHCLYKCESQDDNRGETMFKGEGKELGAQYLRFSLEFIRFLATTWETTKSKGEVISSQFNNIYQNLLQIGVKFPDKNDYFGDLKKKKTQKTQQSQVQTQQPASKAQKQASSPDQILIESYAFIEPLLQLLYANTSITSAIQDKLENDQVMIVSYMSKLQEFLSQEKNFDSLWAFYQFFEHLLKIIQELKDTNYAKKAYTKFRKSVLLQAEQQLVNYWQPPAQAEPQQQQQQQQQPEQNFNQPQETNTGGGFGNWGGDFNQGFDFNAQNQGGAADGFNDGFQNFNFEEQKKIEDQEEQTRAAKIQQEQQYSSHRQNTEDQRKANELVKPQQQNNFFDQEQKELDKQFKGGFDQGFGNDFNNQGFDQGKFDNFGQNNQDFDNGFGTFQEQHHQREEQSQQQQQGGFEFWDSKQQNQEPIQRKKSQDKSPAFNNQFFDNQDTVKERPPAQPNTQDQFGGFGGFDNFNDNQQNNNQTMKKQQKASPRNDNFNNFQNFGAQEDKSHSYTYNIQQQQDNRRGDFRDSFVEFSELSKSDISARDFPLRNTVINIKDVRGTLHPFNKETFQILQEHNVTQQIVRRFKIANLKVKCPLIESSDLQIGVMSERIFDQNSNRYLIKCDLFFGNKTLYNVEHFNIEFEGDHTSHLYIKNDKFPEIIEPKKQYKIQSLLSYTKTPYSLINATVQGSINGREFYITIFVPNLLPRYVHFNEAANNMQYFRQKWRQKRDQIIKSDSFALNKRVIRTPVYFKRYFPQFSENMSLDDFIYHNKNSSNTLNYKLRGNVELDIPSIEYMVKFIVRPNFTAVIQVIPYSGYINTAKSLIDHFVFIFGQQ